MDADVLWVIVSCGESVMKSRKLKRRVQNFIEMGSKTVRDNIPPLTEFPLISSLRIHKAFGISKLGP